jgi:XTP/dITP diphosphohydrolase
LEKKTDLLLATRNAYKTREFAQILGDTFRVSDLAEYPEIPKLIESGKTFEENAILKALAASQDRHLLVMADDSGLEVDALGGAPGIYSARYAGEKATDQQNIDKLLRELARQDLTTSLRAARFRCVIALARDGKLLRTFEGCTEGTIVDPPRGRKGFGYDPIFRPDGFEPTFAELPSEIKNQISHRALAVFKLVDYLNIARPLGQK